MAKRLVGTGNGFFRNSRGPHKVTGVLYRQHRPVSHQDARSMQVSNWRTFPGQ